MSYYLDVKTIILLLAIGHLLSGILIIAYVHKSKTERYVSLFILSKLFALTSWILILLRGHISNLLSILLANYFLGHRHHAEIKHRLPHSGGML